MYLAKLDINQEHTSFSQKCFDMNVPSSINRMNNLKVSTRLNCKLQRENNLKEGISACFQVSHHMSNFLSFTIIFVCFFIDKRIY